MSILLSKIEDALMKKGNLLIVDDEPLILKNLKLHFEDHADIIFTANNGLEALQILETQSVHCVICDINMPKMNGVDVIRNLRAKSNPIPFIFYSGHGNQELMLEAAKHGAFDFLNKPDLDGLEEVIRRGLKEGLGHTQDKDEYSFMSEYSKLLAGLK